jgi:Icc-related predicted phosphoesterase
MRLFFASDLHGSERCFRKFVSAARFYNVELLLLGGDFTGKRMVLLRRRTLGGYEAFEERGRRDLTTSEEVLQYERALADSGIYTVRVDGAMPATAQERAKLHEAAARARLETWIALAEDRLAGTGIRVLVIPGNDDPFSLDSILRDSEVWLNADGRVVQVSDDLQVAGFGYSTPTPWNTPRELPDEEIDIRLSSILARCDPALPLLLDVHVPPFGSGLDTCPVLDKNLRPVVGAGGVETAPVGSRALHRHIIEHQPVLSLHGHVHEGRGCTRIGCTLCANPGSQYSDGQLMGFVATVSGNKVENWLLTEG